MDVDVREVCDDLGDRRWRVAETDTHFIEVVPMLFTWRVHTLRRAETAAGYVGWSERYWCYPAGPAGWAAALLAVAAWDGGDGTEPAGFVRSWDGRHARPGIGQRGVDGRLVR